MNTFQKTTKNDIIADPAAHFDEPVAVLGSEALTKKEKGLALKNWADDAERLSSAANEGMTGGERSLLPEVKAAEAVLEGHSKEPVDPPTKTQAATKIK